MGEWWASDVRQDISARPSTFTASSSIISSSPPQVDHGVTSTTRSDTNGSRLPL